MNISQKYRPRRFEELRGQDHVRTTLQNQIKNGNVAHAYLFCGPRGTGKTTTARLVARAILCDDVDKKTHQACGKCGICEAINTDSLLDLVELDAASHTGVDNIREILEEVRLAPTQAGAKVYIIDECHMLSKNAWNALLKTLEEPDEQVYFILATTEVHKVIPTILSRVQRFDFAAVGEAEITEKLKKIVKDMKRSVTDGAIAMVVKSAEGGMRNAESILQRLLAETDGEIGEGLVGEVLGLVDEEVVRSFDAAVFGSDLDEALKILGEQRGGGRVRNFVLAVREAWHEKRRKMALAGKNNTDLDRVAGIWRDFGQKFMQSGDVLLLEEAVLSIFGNGLENKSVVVEKIVKSVKKSEPTVEKEIKSKVVVEEPVEIVKEEIKEEILNQVQEDNNLVIKKEVQKEKMSKNEIGNAEIVEIDVDGDVIGVPELGKVKKKTKKTEDGEIVKDFDGKEFLKVVRENKTLPAAMRAVLMTANAVARGNVLVVTTSSAIFADKLQKSHDFSQACVAAGWSGSIRVEVNGGGVKREEIVQNAAEVLEML